MKLRHVEEGKVLTFFLDGELNSLNAEEVEKKIDEAIEEASPDAIVLDFEGLTYISSAGLRIIARLKQRYPDTSIRNVSESVYQVLEMVSFHKMLKIEKAAD